MEAKCPWCYREETEKYEDPFAIGLYRVIEEARKNPRPYIVKYLSHVFFLNFDGINTLKSIRPGDKAGDPVVTDIRVLRYEPDDDEWAPIPMSPWLYSEKLKISKQKYQHCWSEK